MEDHYHEPISMKELIQILKRQIEISKKYKEKYPEQSERFDGEIRAFEMILSIIDNKAHYPGCGC